LQDRRARKHLAPRVDFSLTGADLIFFLPDALVDGVALFHEPFQFAHTGSSHMYAPDAGGFDKFFTGPRPECFAQEHALMWAVNLSC
jgi:hypothetical protein